MRDKILAYVEERRGGVSFAELMLLLGDEAAGDVALALKKYENIVVWTGMSEAFYEAIDSLLAEGAVHLDGTSVLVYIIDGRALTLPVARQRRNYRSLRWAPCVINLGPGQKEG